MRNVSSHPKQYLDFSFREANTELIYEGSVSFLGDPVHLNYKHSAYGAQSVT